VRWSDCSRLVCPFGLELHDSGDIGIVARKEEVVLGVSISDDIVEGVIKSSTIITEI
jgi:hypothetical protein